MRYYLAGPMTGIPEFNWPEFKKAASDLRAMGFNIACPTEIANGETAGRGSLPHWLYLKSSLKLLLECEGIILLPGWINSQGAVTEFNVALACGMQPLLYNPDTGSLVQME